MIKESEKKVAQIDRRYKRGFITDQERYRLTVAEWEETTKKVTAKLQENMRAKRYKPDPHDGRFRRAWFDQPDPSAGRYARPDGVHLG